MAGWKHAFSLSKGEVMDATPPGTSRLIGAFHSLIVSHCVLKNPA